MLYHNLLAIMPRFDQSSLPQIPAGFDDVTGENDTHPIFADYDRGYEIHIYPEGVFGLSTETSGNTYHSVMMTEHYQKIMDAIGPIRWICGKWGVEAKVFDSHLKGIVWLVEDYKLTSEDVLKAELSAFKIDFDNGVFIGHEGSLDRPIQLYRWDCSKEGDLTWAL